MCFVFTGIFFLRHSCGLSHKECFHSKNCFVTSFIIVVLFILKMIFSDFWTTVLVFHTHRRLTLSSVIDDRRTRYPVMNSSKRGRVGSPRHWHSLSKDREYIIHCTSQCGFADCLDYTIIYSAIHHRDDHRSTPSSLITIPTPPKLQCVVRTTHVFLKNNRCHRKAHNDRLIRRLVPINYQSSCLLFLVHPSAAFLARRFVGKAALARHPPFRLFFVRSSCHPLLTSQFGSRSSSW